MKIGLTGTSGTGKTTLAHRISKEYDMIHVKGVTRNSPGARMMKVNDQASALNQLCILTTLAAWSEIPNTVSERTPLDALAHSPNVLDQEAWQFAQKITNSAMFNYDLIVYCPYFGWELETDPFRSTNEKFLLGLDSFIASYLTDFVPSGKVITMPDQQVDDRMGYIAEFIG